MPPPSRSSSQDFLRLLSETQPSQPHRVTGSLRRRVLIVVLGLAIVPAMLALVLSYFSATAAVRFTARDQVVAVTQLIADETDRAVLRRAAALSALAASPEFARQAREFGEIVGKALPPVGRLTLEPPPAIPEDSGLRNATLYVLGPRGRYCGIMTPDRLTALAAVPKSLAESSLFRELALRDPDSPFAGESTTAETGKALLLGAPIKAGDGIMLIAELPVDPLLAEVERSNPTLGHRPMFVSSRLGRLRAPEAIAELDEEFANHHTQLFGAESGGEYETGAIRGRQLLLIHRQPRALALLAQPPMPAVRWAVVLALDMGEVTARLSFALWTLVLLGIVLAAVVGGLGMWIAGRLVDPIIRLTGGVQRLAKGDLEYRVSVATGDELETLAHSVNDMAASLRESYQRLGQKLLELDEKARQVELIYSISQSINHSLELDAMFERITSEIRQQVPCERLSLALLDREANRLNLDHVYPAGRDVLPRGSSIPFEGSLMGKAIGDRLPTVHRITAGGDYFEDGQLAPLGIKILCSIPLFATSGPVGALNLSDSDVDRFGRFELEVLTRIAESVALAVEHSRLYSRVSLFAQELEERVDRRTRELMEAQAKLVQTEKFAAAGEIAANVAHEINNPLSIIKNYLKIASGQIGKPQSPTATEVDLTRDSLNVIGEEIDRIARIVAQLRQVNAPTVAETVLCDLNAEIAAMGELFSGSLAKHDVRMRTDLDPAIGRVYVCRDYLRQILINLLRNSIDALEGGGLIVLHSRKLEGEHIEIAVTDNGTGIAPEILSRIFDPFFTTKREGKGTGLGLSVSFGLAKTMGGRLDAESVPGVSTTMRLTIPWRSERLEGWRPDETPIRRSGKRIIIG